MFKKLIFNDVPFEYKIIISINEGNIYLKIELNNNNTTNFNNYLSGFQINDVIGDYDICSDYDFNQDVGFSLFGGGLRKISENKFATDNYNVSLDYVKYIVLDFRNYVSNDIYGGGKIVIKLKDSIQITDTPQTIIIDKNSNKIENIIPIVSLTDQDISEKFNVPIPNSNQDASKQMEILLLISYLKYLIYIRRKKLLLS